jgi:hypothetical protein
MLLSRIGDKPESGLDHKFAQIAVVGPESRQVVLHILGSAVVSTAD